jgi:perosamine synthetase
MSIPLFKVFMPRSVIKPIKDVIFSGYIGQGPRVEKFEHELGAWFASKNVLTLNNGTSAISLALRLSGVCHGDEVITTPMTCVATNEPILAAGAKIIWADIDPYTGNIDPADVVKKITNKTKAIIGVDWGGYPCDLNSLMGIAREHGIKLIEDACHAFGAQYQNRPVGAISDFTCFSFQAIKEITTIDGGALVCRLKKDCERGRLLRWYGIDRRENRKDFRCEKDIKEYGYKFHMNDVSAAIGSEQLKYVKSNLDKTRLNAAEYNKAFLPFRHIECLRYSDDRLSSYWLYTLRVKNPGYFIGYMRRHGITASQVHARNDKHTVFNKFAARLPGVDDFVSHQACIPVGWWLKRRDIAHIINTIEHYNP